MKIAPHLPKSSFRIALIGALLPLGGCLPEPSFPDQPAIEFQSFDLSASGGRELVIGFTDGDGNALLRSQDEVSVCVEPRRPGCWIDRIDGRPVRQTAVFSKGVLHACPFLPIVAR